MIIPSLTPDTVVVISQTAAQAGYADLIAPLVAPVLVAIIAIYGTRTQRRIADDGMSTQRQIAKQGVDTQLEIARRSSVVDARREWIRTLREAAGNLQAKAAVLSHFPPGVPEATRAQRSATLAEIERLMAVIILMLDSSKSHHMDVITAMNALAAWGQEGGQALPAEKPDEGRLLSAARKYPTMGKAAVALDGAVRVLLDEAWAKIKAGE